MINWFDIDLPEYDKAIITMGNFDGIHLGHQKVLHELKRQAESTKLTPVVLTYWEHPGHYVHFKHQVPILTPRVIKKEAIREFGINDVYFLNFTSETAHTSAAAFLKDVIIKHFRPAYIISGYDSHFGYQREGNTDYLMQHEQEYGFKTIQVEPVEFQGTIISSTLIREHLSQGNIQIANAMLGKPYRLYGTVMHGRKIGKTIGFPTINLNLADNEQLVPANGIYLSAVYLNGQRYFGLTNIGVSPTLKNNTQIEIETHILDFSREIYEEAICLDLLHYIRQERHFTGLKELRQAIMEDIRRGKELISKL